ncbi:UbiA family prenyltransferase [Candidatus Kaiserbacteria bacterium]|nr:UbiA family prenyltransferase [Candidatus Kaiserbacteria bacterium]
MFFREIDFESLRGKVILLDLDGTLVPDGEAVLLPQEAHALAELSSRAQVYLVSNKGLTREPELVVRYGIKAIASPHKKPSARILDDVLLPDAPRVVIGDKVVTDGWFAKQIGATFIHVERLMNGEESFIVRLIYALDDMVWEAVWIFSALFASKAWQFVKLARPKQWIKNLLILAPLFFAGGFFTTSLFLQAIFAAVAFSFAASAGYGINDILDRSEDVRHPKKRFRPIASGTISVFEGTLFSLALLFLGAFFASFVPAIIPWLILYFALQYAYSSALRAVPVLEFIVVSSFFVIRILAGGAVVAVPISGWLLLTTFFAALYVTIGRRYSESRHPGTRGVIRAYPAQFLEVIPAVSAVLVIVAYALYSVLGTTHPALVFSNLFVVFGILWYLRGIYAGVAEEPETKLWSDLVLLLAIGLWGLFVLSVFYGRMFS